MFENKFEKAAIVDTFEIKNEGFDVSKMEQKIENAKELKERIKEMYEGEEISKEAQEFLIKLDQLINSLN